MTTTLTRPYMTDNSAHRCLLRQADGRSAGTQRPAAALAAALRWSGAFPTSAQVRDIAELLCTVSARAAVSGPPASSAPAWDFFKSK